MVIEYIPNTCDVNGLDHVGEVMVVLRHGIPSAHWDLSDGNVDLDAVKFFTDMCAVELELKPITKPSKKLVKLIAEYLTANGYEAAE